MVKPWNGERLPPVRVPVDTLPVAHLDAAWLTKINITGQFAHDHDIETSNHFILQARSIGEFRIKRSWPQISK